MYMIYVCTCMYTLMQAMLDFIKNIHMTLETIETIVLYEVVSKPFSAVSYVRIYANLGEKKVPFNHIF